jgi:hypothetical protein
MKKLFVTLAMFALVATTMFAQTTITVNDNTATTTKNAKSTFAATVIAPLTFSASTDIALGTFVQSTSAYDVTGTLTFSITGEAGKDILVTPKNTNGPDNTYALLTLTTPTLPTVIDATGANKGKASFKIDVTKVLASAPGTTTYTYEYDIAYNF